jgi:hypothetical protein
MPGRFIGGRCGEDAFNLAKTYFYADKDTDGFYSYEDCDDLNATIYPGAPELCDGLDNDCNGLSDDGLTQYQFYVDIDGDGFGTEAEVVSSCLDTIPVGFSIINTDCDDANAAIYPGAVELCDGIDNDCNGLLDDGLTQYQFYVDADGDGFGTEADVVLSCLDTIPAGYSTINTDCDDTNTAIYPGAVELCDGLDNNCDGQKDEGFPIVTYYADADNDGFGNSVTRVDTCLAGIPLGFVINDLDCNDADALVNPNGWELPGDGIDNNCDGIIDNVSSTTEIGGTQFRVYPNPVSSYLIIDYPNSTGVELKIIEPSGRTISASYLEDVAHRSKIDCSSLPSGIYFLHLTDTGSGANSVIRIVRSK